MIKSIFLFVLFVCANGFAMADSQLTPIEAHLRCEDSGGGVALQLNPSGLPKVAWQSDRGSDDGLLYKILSVQAKQPQGSFLLLTELTFFGQKANLRIMIEKQDSEFLLKSFSLKNEKNKWERLKSNVPCKIVSHW